MNLTDAQLNVVALVATAEARSKEQMLSLLLIEAVEWYYINHDSRYGDVNTTQLTEMLWEEVNAKL